MEKVMLAMSGGVDSSAAAAILQSKGYEVIGVTFDMIGDGTVFNDAEAVAEKLGIEHIQISLQEEFKKQVIDNFKNTYICGGTPNPCIICNERVKFKYLLSAADEYNCKYIATGHYARIDQDESTGRYCIFKGKSTAKDQSYMLYRLNQKVLSRLIFPLGELEKKQVRKIAMETGIHVADKGDSQDICFIPDGDYAAFLEDKCMVSSKTGDFMTADGKVLGKHKGIIHYTVGQRKGLGLALPRPMYVTEKNVTQNAVVLGLNEDLFKNVIFVSDTKWMKFERLTNEITVSVKIRYSQKESMAEVIPMENGCKLIFEEPQRAPAKGQSAVFYIGEQVIGGGIIE